MPSWGGGQLARLVRVGRRECRKNGFSASGGVFFSGSGGAATPLVLVLGQGRANAGSHAVFGLLSPFCIFRTAWLSGICSFWLWPPGRFLFWCANTPVRVFRFSPVGETRPERDIVNEPLPGAFAVPPLVGIP